MDLFGAMRSLRKSFKASANGCGTPIIRTLFGPFRRWINPRSFRSNKVKKAIESIAHTIVRRVEIEVEII